MDLKLPSKGRSRTSGAAAGNSEVAAAGDDACTQVIAPSPYLDVGEPGALADVEFLAALTFRRQGLEYRLFLAFLLLHYRLFKPHLVYGEIDDVTPLVGV